MCTYNAYTENRPYSYNVERCNYERRYFVVYPFCKEHRIKHRVHRRSSERYHADIYRNRYYTRENIIKLFLSKCCKENNCTYGDYTESLTIVVNKISINTNIRFDGPVVCLYPKIIINVRSIY